MSETKMSRRAWFRLRPQLSEETPTPEPVRAAAVGEQTIGLSPVEQPPNHDGMDLSQLPPMREALLSQQQVDELFNDIEHLATDVLLMQRRTTAARDRATAAKADTATSLQVARASLCSGSIPRVQIRYRWQDSLWIDTLEVKPDGFRLVRIAHAGMK